MNTLLITTLFFHLMIVNTDPYPDFSNSTLSEIQQNEQWEIIAEARGALDKDDREDLAMILQSKDPISEKRCDDCEVQNHKARIIVVLLSKGDAMKVVAQNNYFIAREDEGGITKNLKPELSIEGRQLNVFYLFLRGESNYIFEVERDEVVLVRATKLSASHYLYRSDAVDFKRGTLVTESRSEEDEPAKTKTIKVDQRLKKISELGMMGTWEVGEGVFF